MSFGKLVDISDEDEFEDQDLLSKDNFYGGSNNYYDESSSGDELNAENKVIKKKKAPPKRTKEEIRELTEKQSELDKRIARLLSTIETAWAPNIEFDDRTVTIEGELLKKKRFASGWKKYYFALCGNNLYYYSNKNSKKAKGVITISFVSPPMVLSEKNIVDINTPYISNYSIQLYSHKRIDTLVALSNEDFEKWNGVLQDLVKSNLHRHDYEDRLEAFNEVHPLFEKKSEMELDRLLLMLAEIDSYSTHIITKARKDKTGNLLLMEDDEETGQITWRSYYFALLEQCLYFYKSSRLPPQGVITLKYSDVSVCNTNVSTDLKNSFKLSTPLSVFILKAKHQVAMEDWIRALNAAKNHGSKKSNKNSGDNIPNDHNYNGAETSIIPTPNQEQHYTTTGLGKKFIPTLTYTLYGAPPGTKAKVVKLSLGSHTIGRSDSCSIVIDDKKVSRTHCKIEVQETCCIIMDLGSGHGTKVNRKSIDKLYLAPTNEIKIGKTKITFDIILSVIVLSCLVSTSLGSSVIAGTVNWNCPPDSESGLPFSGGSLPAEKYVEFDIVHQFPLPCNEPIMVFGFGTLDVKQQHNTRVTHSFSNIKAGSFTLRLSSWSDTVVYRIGGSWTAVCPYN
eukprot:gene3989-4990_t